MKLCLRCRDVYENSYHLTIHIMEAKTLHKIAEGESGNFEDTSTYLGSPVVEKSTTSKQ